MTSKQCNTKSDDSDSIETMDLTQEDDEDILNYECTDSLPSTISQTSSASSLTTTSQSTTSSRSRNSRKSVGSLQSKNTKKNKTAEKEAKKQRMAEEKALKSAANEINKIYKPGECMKVQRYHNYPD
ncbi:uncharacterized protein ACR2FA_008160 [Aphomia sociella]